MNPLVFTLFLLMGFDSTDGTPEGVIGKFTANPTECATIKAAYDAKKKEALDNKVILVTECKQVQVELPHVSTSFGTITDVHN